MADDREHPYVPTLKRLYAERRCSRSEFLRTATLLGVGAAAAYAFAGRVDGGAAIPSAAAQPAPRRGGSLRLSARVREVSHPHRLGNVPASNLARQTLEYLANTGVDNVTRPMLL